MKPFLIVSPITTVLASSPLWKWKARRGMYLVPAASMIVLAMVYASSGSVDIRVMLLPLKSIPSGLIT